MKEKTCICCGNELTENDLIKSKSDDSQEAYRCTECKHVTIFMTLDE